MNALPAGKEKPLLPAEPFPRPPANAATNPRWGSLCAKEITSRNNPPAKARRAANRNRWQRLATTLHAQRRQLSNRTTPGADPPKGRRSWKARCDGHRIWMPEWDAKHAHFLIGLWPSDCTRIGVLSSRHRKAILVNRNVKIFEELKPPHPVRLLWLERVNHALKRAGHERTCFYLQRATLTRPTTSIICTGIKHFSCTGTPLNSFVQSLFDWGLTWCNAQC